LKLIKQDVCPECAGFAKCGPWEGLTEEFSINDKVNFIETITKERSV
jgi:hypothetical protein